MSSNWAEYGFGLVLFEDSREFDAFMKAYNSWCKKEFGIKEEVDAYEMCMDKDFEGKTKVFVRFMDDEFDGKRFKPAIEDAGEEREHENMLTFWAEKQPNPFSTAYTKESIVEEFKDRIGEFLPDDFDYLAHIGYFSGCVYC